MGNNYLLATNNSSTICQNTLLSSTTQSNPVNDKTSSITSSISKTHFNPVTDDMTSPTTSSSNKISYYPTSICTDVTLPYFPTSTCTDANFNMVADIGTKAVTLPALEPIIKIIFVPVED